MRILLFNNYNLNEHVPDYLNSFLSADEFDHASELLTQLFENIGKIIERAPAAPHMDKYVAVVTKCYFDTKAFCDHVAPEIYYDYRPKIRGAGNDYDTINVLWRRTFKELSDNMPEFLQNIETLRKNWNARSASADPRRAVEFARAAYYWGSSLARAQEFLKMCDINSKRLEKIRPPAGEKINLAAAA